MSGSKALDSSNRDDIGRDGASPGTRTLGTILGVIALVLVLTWAVSVFFEIALVKALAAVILVLFGVIVALFMFGIT
jgi:hypothetical protein